MAAGTGTPKPLGNVLHLFFLSGVHSHQRPCAHCSPSLGIYSTGDGVVAKVEKNKSGYGNNVLIDHGYGYKTRYAHLHTIKVKKGEKVKRGQEIGTMGNTGKSTAPHLHYEVIKNNKTVNPINFFYNDITPEEYDKILELSQLPSQTMD